MLNSQLQSDPIQDGATRSPKSSLGLPGADAYASPQAAPLTPKTRTRRSRSVTVPASPMPAVSEASSSATASGTGEETALTIEQLQAEVNRCQAELKAAEREGSLRAGLIRKLCEDLREPISNINMAVRMLGQAKSESETIRYGSILRTECARQLEILNNVNRMQIVMGTYGNSKAQ